jgi:hypothetical protein
MAETDARSAFAAKASDVQTTMEQANVRVARAAAGNAARPWASTRFYWCVGILLVSAAGMQGLAAWFQNYFRKLELPLKQPLYQLNASRLEPEYIRFERQPQPLGDEELENLGTRELLNWVLVDTTRKPGDPTRLAHLFVTYHTGKPDMVPHEPRECRRAAGQSLVGEQMMTVAVDGPEGHPVEIPVAVLDFEEPPRAEHLGAAPRKQTVMFFFWANGRYVTTRNEVRVSVANLAHRYAYYTKFEVSFSDEQFRVYPDRETAKSAGAALLRKLLPVMWQDIYQDWNAILAGKPPVTGKQ